MIEIVCRFPVVEHFVAILYWRIECSETIRKEENVEGYDWREKELAWRLPLETIRIINNVLIQCIWTQMLRFCHTPTPENLNVDTTCLSNASSRSEIVISPALWEILCWS